MVRNLSFWWTRRPAIERSVAFVAGAVIGAGLVYGVLLMLSGQPIEAESEGTQQIERSLPAHISVPSLGIEADFEAPLGVDNQGEMSVPEGFDTVGWYQYSPTPGELGPAVILGHVDSQRGPQVFHPLKDIKDNDVVEVTREDGSIAIFRVYQVDYYSQNRFPSDAVYGNVDRPELRLITCAGVFNKGSRRYSHNLVVYAYLIDFKPATDDMESPEL